MAKKKLTLEDISAMTQRGFDDAAKRVDERFEELKAGQKALENKFDAMWYELKDIKKQLEHVANRNGLEALKDRVKHLEDRFAVAMRKR